MKQQPRLFVRKTRQFQHLLKQINDWIQSGRFSRFSEERQRRLLNRLKRLSLSLKGRLSPKAYKMGLATFALLASMQTQAQVYTTPQTNPFGLGPAQYFALASTVDLDNDGDLDIMVGEYYGNFKYYENTGTASSPSYAAPVQNPFGINAGYVFSDPTFADLDNDGDLDMIAGNYGGNILYYENTGNASSPTFATPLTNPFGLSQMYQYAFPEFVDLDDDGDYDLIVTEYYGVFYYFENTGTAMTPAFAAPVMNPFGITNMNNYFSVPTIGDLDGDGDFDIMTGEYYGAFNYFENTGTNTTPAFAAGQMNPFSLTATYQINFPAFGDLDNDGDLDIITGEGYANLLYFENVDSLGNSAPMVSSIPNDTICLGDSAMYNFMASDAQGDSLTLVASSNNQTLLPNANLSISGATPNYILTANPVAGMTGLATITIDVSDSLTTSSVSFDLIVDPCNAAPIVDALNNEVICDNDTLGPIAFTASDPEGANIILTATSSNMVLVPANNVLIGGVPPNYTLTVIPAPNENGLTDITVSADDGLNVSSSSFQLQVNDCNDAAIVDAIPNQTVCNDTTLGPIFFNAQDPDGDMLTITAVSSDQSLIMDANILIGGAGPSYTIDITPEMGAAGTSTVTVTADDGNLSTQTSFDVEVEDCSTGINDPEWASLVKVFPNPTQGELIIEMDQWVPIQQIRLLDLQGKMVRKWPIEVVENRYRFDLSGLAKGLYLLEIQSDDGRIVQKVRKD